MKTAETVGCFLCPWAFFIVPFFVRLFRPFFPRSVSLTFCPTPGLAPRFVSRRMPGGAYDKIRASDRVACGHVGAGAYAGTPPCAKNPLFPTDVLFFRLLEKNANGGGRGAFPVKNIVFSGRKTGIRKKETERRRALFSKLFFLYGSLVQKLSVHAPSRAPFCNSCRRMSHFMAPLCKGSCHAQRD